MHHLGPQGLALRGGYCYIPWFPIYYCIHFPMISFQLTNIFLCTYYNPDLSTALFTKHSVPIYSDSVSLFSNVVVSLSSLYWCQGSLEVSESPTVLVWFICLDTEYYPFFILYLVLRHPTVRVGKHQSLPIHRFCPRNHQRCWLVVFCGLQEIYSQKSCHAACTHPVVFIPLWHEHHPTTKLVFSLLNICCLLKTAFQQTHLIIVLRIHHHRIYSSLFMDTFKKRKKPPPSLDLPCFLIGF